VRLSRISRKPVEVDVTVTLPSGAPAPLTAVDFALCDHGGPTAGTTWLAGSVDGETATVTVAGPDAPNKAGALVMTAARMELWAKPANGPTVAADYIDTIELP
jgi:ABC-type molybdate transport system permease subunit